MRPSKCPTNQCWISFSQEKFTGNSKRAKNLSIYLPPSKWIFWKIFVFLESSSMGFLLRFQYQSCLAISIFGSYVMVGSVIFWLGWLCSLCWGHYEAGPNFLGLIWSIGVWRLPTFKCLVISASLLIDMKNITSPSFWVPHPVVIFRGHEQR